MVDENLQSVGLEIEEIPVEGFTSEGGIVDTSADIEELILPTVRVEFTEGPNQGKIGVFDKKTEEFIRFEDTQEDQIGTAEAAGRGLISGLTSRLAPLAVGAVEAPIQAVKDLFELMQSGVRPSEFTEEQRDQLSQFLDKRNKEAAKSGAIKSARRFEQAREQFPVISGATELAGSIGQAFAIPGAGISRVAGPAVAKATGSRVLGGLTRLGIEATESAAFGGLEALGTQSELLVRGDTEQALESAKQAAGVSAILGPAIGGLVPLAKAVGSTIGSIKNALADISPSAVSFIRRNTDLVTNAKTSGELADSFANRFKQLSDEVLEESQALKEGLSNEPRINKSTINKVFNKLINETDTEGQKSANSKLIAFQKDTGLMFGDLISERNIKDIVDDLNTFAFSGSTILTDNVTKNSIRKASRQINQILKDANSEFAIKISKVEDKLNALENFEKKFALKAEPGRQIEAQDSTIQSIRNTLNPDKIGTTRAVDQLDEAFGTDLGQQARATAAAEDLRIIDRPVKKGIQAGGLVRELTTAIAGRSIVGAEKLLGPTLEFIDKNLKKLGQFRKPLEDAARRGPQALASTFFVMSSNQDFRKIIKDIEEEEAKE